MASQTDIYRAALKKIALGVRLTWDIYDGSRHVESGEAEGTSYADAMQQARGRIQNAAARFDPEMPDGVSPHSSNGSRIANYARGELVWRVTQGGTERKRGKVRDV